MGKKVGAEHPPYGRGWWIMAEGPGVGRADSNVYTILLIIATVVMIGATVYVGIRHQQLFGTLNPFTGA